MPGRRGRTGGGREAAGKQAGEEALFKKNRNIFVVNVTMYTIEFLTSTSLRFRHVKTTLNRSRFDVLLAISARARPTAWPRPDSLLWWI